MEIIAVNKSKLYREDFEEAAPYVSSKIGKLCFTVAGIALLFCGIWMYQIKGLLGKSDFMPLFCILLAVLFLLCRCVYHKLSAFFAFGKERSRVGYRGFDFIEQKISFCQDHLLIDYPHRKTEMVPYEHLHQVRFTDHLIFLFCQDHTVLFLRTDSFATGGETELEAFFSKTE